mmetsp:Transcript_34057/g.58842  ORF Transcript_34057/g.58842 Transcript_34057/m.58842 type:complete len:223 (-) Transcript_34057:800-1468(-)
MSENARKIFFSHVKNMTLYQKKLFDSGKLTGQFILEFQSGPKVLQAGRFPRGGDAGVPCQRRLGQRGARPRRPHQEHRDKRPRRQPVRRHPAPQRGKVLRGQHRHELPGIPVEGGGGGAGGGALGGAGEGVPRRRVPEGLLEPARALVHRCQHEVGPDTELPRVAAAGKHGLQRHHRFVGVVALNVIHTTPLKDHKAWNQVVCCLQNLPGNGVSLAIPSIPH